MPVFTAAAAAISTFVAGITLASVQAFAVRTLATIAISALVANRANKKSVGANDVGARVQLGPATNNKLPVTYGTAFLAPTITDAKITTDQKTMYYVFSLSEASSGTMSFGKIFWNGKEVTLGAGDYSANNKVVSLTTNSTPPQVDDTIDGHAWIYKFSNGSSSGTNTGGTSAITILSDAGIPVADRWTSTDVMSNTCFIIVKVIYNKDVQDAQQMPRLSVQLTNTLTKPGAVFLDYMTNTVYGCAIDVANVDTASLTALDAYSDELITYVPVGGGSATQPRYRIDGPVNTGDNCLSNLQQLADACDSWLQYSELTAKWTIVMNKPYTGTLSSLYSVDSSVLIGGIDINPLDLNQTYNSLEVQYPNANINDQTDYKVVDLTTSGTAWYNPSLLSPNEPDNRLVIQYPQINNYVRAVYLGVRRLLQSREDLTISCNLDYSGIQVTAGDVVRVTLAEYGWTDKLFRVSQVQETKTTEGFLGSRIVAFEYNANVYADNALDDFIPEANTGLKDPNIFDKPTTPIVTLAPVANGAINYYSVSSNVPAVGTTLYMDFNIGNSSNIETHRSYSSVQVGDGTPYSANSTITINVADSSPGTYYWSATARNDIAGRQSNSSTAFTWAGPSVTTYNANTGNGGVQYNQINATSISGVRRTISGVNWSVESLQVPFVAVSSSTHNIPVVVPPISTIYAWPALTGDSNTAAGTNGNNYYAANSTGVGTPANAWQLLVASGDDNWWAITDDVSYSAGTMTSTETAYMNSGITVFSDTANTIVQVSVGVKLGTNTYFQVDTTKLATIYIPDVTIPIQYTALFTFAPGNTIAGGAIMMRNLGPGNVGVVSGTLATSAGTNPYI